MTKVTDTMIGVGTESLPEPTIGKTANTAALEKAGTENKTSKGMPTELGEPAKDFDEDTYKVYGPERA